MKYAPLALSKLPNIKKLVRPLFNGVCAVACAAVLGSTGSEAGPVRQISGFSPFANCTADNPTGQAGTLYPDSEIEPWIDVNPANPRNLIAGWQQDRWSNGGARGLVAGFSIDGGATWARSVPPRISKCSGGVYDRASDPWVTISPSGRAFFMSLAFMNDRPDGGGGENAMLVSRSDNGGISWSNPIPLIIDTDGQIFNDKNTMTADPFDSRYVYAVWDRIQDFTLPSGRQAPTNKVKATGSSSRDGVVNARERYRANKRSTSTSGKTRAAPIFFKGPTIFVRTTNGGQTWEIPKKIYDPGGNAQTINNIVQVLANGAVANFFTDLPSTGETRIGMMTSNNHGSTFNPATYPIDMNVTFTGTITPDNLEPVRDANILFDVAVDRGNGNIYLVWQDGRWGNIDRVAFSQSTDGGASWSDPIRINMTPVSTTKLRNQAFVPSVEVGSGHKVVVTYYDFRFDTSNGKEATDYFAVMCTPGAGVDCSLRRNWGDGTTRLKDLRLTDRSFNMLDAPVARGHFLGDYMGLVRKGGTVVPAFGIANSLNHTSINTKAIQTSATIVSRGTE